MTKPRYSIIIPHHNTPRLLRRLLDTIPQRDDTEVIIVDDNSDPSVVDFSTFPGLERKGCKVIFDKKGGFGGYARNIGLGVASGEWILFADSDDFFTYCFGEVLDECYNIPDDVDLVFFNACSLDTETYVNSQRSGGVNKNIRDYESGRVEEAELQLRYKFGEPWCKLARKSMIDAHHIRFEERSIHNDTAYSYLVGYYARNISVCSKAIYCITDRVSSVSKVVTEAKKLERIDNFATSAMFFKSHNIPMEENWHFSQLFQSYRENKDTYRKGVDILLSHGYTHSQIRKALFMEFARRAKGFVIGKMKGLVYGVYHVLR